MDEEVEAITEVAKAGQEVGKAGQEVAKTVSNAINTGTDLGTFLGKIFGPALLETGGLAADYISGFRQRRLADIQVKTDAYLAAKGVRATQPISPRLGYRILDEATLEDDDDLTARFARLLAEALDPAGEKITRRHADAVAALTSESVVLLDYCWRNRNQVGFVTGSNITYQKLQTDNATRSLAEVNVAVKASEDTVRYMVYLGLIKPVGEEYNVVGPATRSFGEARPDQPFERVNIYGDVERFEFTDFGISFCKAVIAPLEKAA